jgi:hypothetical protein
VLVLRADEFNHDPGARHGPIRGRWAPLRGSFSESPPGAGPISAPRWQVGAIPADRGTGGCPTRRRRRRR